MTLRPARPTIGRWTTGHYAALLRPWIIAGLSLALLVAVLTIARPALGWVGPLISIGIGWQVSRWGGGRLEALAAGAIAGTVLGAAAAILRLVTDPGLVTGLNLVTETILTAVVGAALGASTHLLTQHPKN